jgi:hypothetical protein
MQHANNVASTVVDSVKAITAESQKQTAKYLLSGMAIAVGLGWNEAIKSAIKSRFPMDEEGVRTKFIYAACLTLFLVILSITLTKINFKPPEPTTPSCVCADNDEVKKITLQLDGKIEAINTQRKMEKAGIIN